MTAWRMLPPVAALLLLATAAAAQPHFLFDAAVEGGPLPGAPFAARRLEAALDLTAEQQAAVETLREELAEQAAPLVDQHRREMEAIHDQLEAGGADPTAIGERMIAAHETRRQLRAVHEDYLARFAALLDAEQRATFDELQARRREGDAGFARRWRRR